MLLREMQKGVAWAQRTAGQDIGALVSRLAGSLDHLVGATGRRAICTAVFAASMAGSFLLYGASKPVLSAYETQLEAQTVSYMIADTVRSKPVQHVVKPGESLWRIVRVDSEPASATAERVKQVCADNPQLPKTDNRSYRNGKLSHEPDGIGCDHLPVGASIRLPIPPPKVVYRKHEAMVYRQKAASETASAIFRPGMDIGSQASSSYNDENYDRSLLFLSAVLASGAVCAAAFSAKGFTYRLPWRTGKQSPAELPLRFAPKHSRIIEEDPHARYKPKGQAC